MMKLQRVKFLVPKAVHPHPDPLPSREREFCESMTDDDGAKNKISRAQMSNHPGKWHYSIKPQLDSGACPGPNPGFGVPFS